jgi:hypothetical protein
MRQRMRRWEDDDLPPPLLLSPGQAEQLVGIRAEEIRRLAGSPGGPAVVKLSPKRIMYIRADLLAWIARQTTHSPAILQDTG